MDTGSAIDRTSGIVYAPADGGVVVTMWGEIDAALRDQAQAYGYTVVDASTVVATHLNHLILSHAAELLGRPVAELLAPLNAPHGVYAILGNHDDDRTWPRRSRGITMRC